MKTVNEFNECIELITAYTRNTMYNRMLFGSRKNIDKYDFARGNLKALKCSDISFMVN